nr:hypothetical protein [Eubacterium sp.]
MAALGSGAGTVYADPTTEAATSGGSSSGTETTEEGKVETKILDDDHGRISFWEWERLDETNMNDLLGDGKFHACMFQYDETLNRLEGGKSIRPRFISTYADNEHIYLLREPVNAGWYDHFDRLVDVAGDQYTNMIDRLFGIKVPYHNDPFYYAFDQYENFFIKMDKDGTVVATRATVSKDSKIENRRGGTAIFGAAVTDSSVILWKFKIGLRDKTTSYGLSCDKEGVVDIDMKLRGGGLVAPLCYWGSQPSDNKGWLINDDGG